MSTPRNYKGTKDYFSQECAKREWATGVLREVFELFGFEPLETPVIEYRDTLLGKGGAETNPLIYLFSKRRDELGLRFDHTVPLARVAAQYSRQLVFPYRRYAIGPVFRADPPQRGRSRQFVQCDFDIIGVADELADAEVIALTYTALVRLGFRDFKTHFFDRRALNGMAMDIGAGTKEQVLAILRGWDKLDKAERGQIEVEITKAGAPVEVISNFNSTTDRLLEINSSSLSFEEAIKEIRLLFKEQGDGPLEQGISVLEKIVSYLDGLGVPRSHTKLDSTLARGLEYYTGPIFETKVPEAGVGSITGGGRFDNLIAELGGPDIPGTGSSFGLERILETMELLGIGPVSQKTPVEVFVASFDPSDLRLVKMAISIASEMRNRGLKTEMYQGKEAIGGQIRLADRRGVRWVVFAGPDEIKDGLVVIKDLHKPVDRSGDPDSESNQIRVPWSALLIEVERRLSVT